MNWGLLLGALYSGRTENCFPAVVTWVHLSGAYRTVPASLSALPASLSAAWVVAGRPIRGRQSGSGGKKQVKSVLHPPTHESSPSRADSRKFQQDRGPRENPAKRFSWGEDERRNERAFGVSRKRGIWRLRGRGPAPNASTESFLRSLLLEPPYHKQIRHTVPFCAPVPFSSTGRGAFFFGKTKKNGGRISQVR